MVETEIAAPDEILQFWFDSGPEKWWMKDFAFDRKIRDLFGATHDAAGAGHLDAWADNARGALALTIVLDQFSRNLFRGDPRAYTNDETVRGIARKAIANAFDQQFPVSERVFFFLPFMHSESLADQDYCVSLYRAAGDENGITHAQAHADIIRRFGRFPHRNNILQRPCSPAEQFFLKSGGFAG